MTAPTPISAIIFDVDDTLYDISTGFTDARNGPYVQRFMVEHLNFPDMETAGQLRQKYFDLYHSTTKALAVAEQEGMFPPSDQPAPRFTVEALSEYFAEHLPYEMLGAPMTDFLKDLRECKVKHLIAFSNGPRKYIERVLQQLGLDEVFSGKTLYAVDDVLPHCKPEKEAFDVIFKNIGVRAEECVMVEDSMKNVRRAKELGMKTVLIVGKESDHNKKRQEQEDEKESSDAPAVQDTAVDVALETVGEMRQAIPGLWANEPVFVKAEDF